MFPLGPDTLEDVLIQRDMIRDRALMSYAELLGFDLVGMADEKVRSKGSFVWYDMCSGNFLAGSSLGEYFYAEGAKEGGGAEGGEEMLAKLTAVGVDLVTTYGDSDRVIGYDAVIKNGNVVDFPIPPNVDLITCLRGLWLLNEYLGESAVLEAVEHWYNSMPVGGTLAFGYSLSGHTLSPITIDGVSLPQLLRRSGADFRMHTGRYSTPEMGIYSSFDDEILSARIHKQTDERLVLAP